MSNPGTCYRFIEQASLPMISTAASATWTTSIPTNINSKLRRAYPSPEPDHHTLLRILEMSSNDRIKRAPKNPLSDAQYLAKYGKPCKCLHCTNSNRTCTGGRPCDRCENNGRVCTNVITKLPFARPGPAREEEKFLETNNGTGADFGDKEEEDKQIDGFLGEKEGQGLDEYFGEDHTDVLGYDAQDSDQFPASFISIYLQPTYSRAEDEIRLIRARDRGSLIPQPQFPAPPPQRVSMAEVFELPEGSYPEDAVRYFHGPGLYGLTIDLEKLERAPGDMRRWRSISADGRPRMLQNH
ncbi:hypothetical protein DL98DRAFT_586023 [Cadophora sp. DSE1049]|nr:hypothetical protein DL98DRAFT_586023 [Cadophora sp. DSE1049]